MMLNLSWLLLFVFIKTIVATDRPIIGILAQEIEPDDPNRVYNYTSYFAASYVKAVEAAGARVVPVFIRRDASYYQGLVRKLNGFLLTGGNSNLMADDGVARSGKIVLDAVLEINKRGEHVPILGVCQGMELLAVLSNGWNPILTKCSADNEALTLKLLPEYLNSSLYQGASQEDLYTLTNLPSTANHHMHCLTQRNLTRFNLTQWQVLSTSVSHDDFTFVSSMEWNSLPIAAVQFHPEKLAYEWKPRMANPHDAKSISAARLFYDWLVAHSRLNTHTFSDLQEEQNNLIYNYSPMYTGKKGQYDTQDYYFTDPPMSSGNVYQFQ